MRIVKKEGHSLGWKGLSIGILLGLGVTLLLFPRGFFSFRLSFSDWMYSIDLLDNDLSVYPKASEISRKYFTG